jgi:hypothetical protein
MQKASSHRLHLTYVQWEPFLKNFKFEISDFQIQNRLKSLHWSIGQMEPAPTHCKLTVSVLFHSPNRGSFHLSLAVLVHYRLPISI